jgi:hypothetical protein
MQMHFVEIIVEEEKQALHRHKYYHINEEQATQDWSLLPKYSLEPSPKVSQKTSSML